MTAPPTPTPTPASATRDVWAPFRSLVGGQGASVLLGLLFWVLVARIVPAAEVGVAAAAISTQTLLGLVASLGVGTHLVTALPGAGLRRRALLLRGLAAVAAAGAGLGVLVALGARLAGGALGTAASDVRLALVLVGGSAVAAVVLVLDEAVLGLRRAPVQLLRNVTASGLRLPLAAALTTLGARDALTIQACWVLPLAVSVAVAWRRLGLERDASDRVGVAVDLREHGPAALRHHLLNLAVAAATQLVPVAAGLTLVATDNAAFAVAWLLATVAYLPPYLLSVSLFATVANDGPDAFRGAMRRTLPVALGIALVTVAGAWVLGGTVLAVFGGAYAERADLLLALLVPAVVWMVVKDHLVAWWRARRRFTLASGLAAASLVLEIGGAAVGGVLHGPTGLALGWLAAMALELVVAGPLLWRVLVPPRRSREEVRPRLDAGVVGSAGLCVLVLAILTWLVVPGVQQLRSAGSGTSSATAPTSGACAGGAVPALDLSVKTDTGDPARPHLGTASVERLVDAAAGAGASIVSTTVSWRAVRPSPRAPYDFRGLDRLLTSAATHDLDVRVVVVHTPAWAVDGGTRTAWQPPTTGPELRRWSRFVGDLVTHLGGRARYLETWTEPNRADTWTTGPDPAAFARLLTATARAARVADPALVLVSGGLASNDVGFAREVVAALDGARPFDLFGVHPWSRLEPTASHRWRGDARVDDAFRGFRAVQREVEAPLYLGEVGWSLGRVDEATRARWAVEALDLADCSGVVVALSWYHLHPTPWDPASWALLDRGGRPGATYDALRGWTARHHDRPTRSA